MKIDWNRKYTTIAVYAVLVVFASLICYNMLHDFDSYKKAFKSLVAVLQPVIYGFSIAFLLNPIVRFFEKKALPKLVKGKLKAKWNKGLSILLAYLVAVLFIGVFLWVVVPQVTASIAGIISNLSNYREWVSQTLERLFGWLNRMFNSVSNEAFFQETMEKINDVTRQLLDDFYNWLSSSLPKVLDATINVTTGLTNVVLGLIVSVYFLYGKERFIAQLKKVLYAFLPEDFVGRLILVTHTSNRIFSGFISGKLLDSLIIGILCFVGMSILNMPMAMLISVIVGVTNVIPYFGPFIGAIPSILILFLIDPFKAVWFGVFILALQQFDGNILGPYILGDSIGMPAFWVIFSILVFGSYLGVLGMFIGVPTFAVVYSIFKMWTESRLKKKNLSIDTASYASEEHPLL